MVSRWGRGALGGQQRAKDSDFANATDTFIPESFLRFMELIVFFKKRTKNGRLDKSIEERFFPVEMTQNSYSESLKLIGHFYLLENFLNFWQKSLDFLSQKDYNEKKT